MKFPEFGSSEYFKMKKDGQLIRELGEVIIKQYGEEESIKLLIKFNESEKKKLSAT